MNKIVVMDRDGVINVATPWKYCHRAADWEWTYKAKEAFKLMVDAGYRLVINTNQSGIGEGHYTLVDYYDLMSWASTEVVAEFGTRKYWPELVVQCYHKASERCDCRKPRTGLWYDRILPRFHPIDMEQSWMVGDRDTDIEFGRRVGLSTAKIPEEYENLYQFAVKITGARP